MNRKEWKNEWANKKYGMSYDALCNDRKRIVDQMFLLFEMENEEKTKGCR
jgi:hypothetical protein